MDTSVLVQPTRFHADARILSKQIYCKNLKIYSDGFVKIGHGPWDSESVQNWSKLGFKIGPLIAKKNGPSSLSLAHLSVHVFGQKEKIEKN